MTKETLLDPHLKYAWKCDESEAVIPYSAAEKAMDIWGRQQAIAFMNWTLESDCQYSCTDENQWTSINDASDSITTEQLHNQFIEQQNENK